MRILKIIFVLTILLFPLGELARFEFRNGIAVILNDILVGITVVFWMMWKVRLTLLKETPSRRSLLSQELFKPIILFIAIGVLSLLVSIKNLDASEFFTSFLYLIRWVMYVGIYFVVRSFDLSFKSKIPIVLSISGIMIVLGGYIQYFSYPALRNLYYLGWDEHLYRMFSSFLDPNFAGIFFVLFILFNTKLCLDNFKHKDWVKAVLFSIIELLTLGAIFLTYSRSSLIALFFGSICFLFLINKKKLILGLLAIFTLFIFISPRAFQTEGTNLLRTASSNARLDSAGNALTIFKENPIVGVGFNAYRYAQYRYGFIKGENWQNSHAGAGTDNSFLFILATTGILGLVSYIYLLINILKTKDALIKSSFIALLISAFFINSLFYPFLMEWMWILLALKENK